VAHHVCPFWIGYLLLSPLRRLFESPEHMLGPFVDKDMIVLEPGCGMGYFTLPLARMVGPGGKVVALEIQDRMFSVLNRRARKAGLMERIETRLAHADSLGLVSLSGQVDFTAAIHMVHEVNDPFSFLSEVWTALKWGGKLLLVEPRHHVTQRDFDQTLSLACRAGFSHGHMPVAKGDLRALLVKYKQLD
jgi:ubiquinone/menaquinone biosynthesis C-methylase UbiE